MLSLQKPHVLTVLHINVTVKMLLCHGESQQLWRP